MAPLLGLQDPSHEKFAETKENAKAPFLRIPLEIRLLIYEYATYEEKPINPKQLTARSNKFSSGIMQKTKKGSKPKNRKMFISDLVRVSRQIYTELENNPVFYRVNEFQFQEPARLLHFLAAITPERRAFLRHIVVQFSGASAVVMLPGLGAPPNLFTMDESAEVLRHVAALLSCCEDLRHLEMRFHSLLSWDYDSMIQKFTQQITSDNLRNTLWSFPCIEPSFVNTQGRAIDLMATRTEESSAIDAPDLSDRTIELIAEAKTALMSLKQHLREEERNGNGFWDQYTNSQVLEAIAYSQVDFPGESRIEQDRFNSVAGAISTRTRQKCKKDSVDNNGVIQRARSKYDAEGILAWDNFLIKKLRWNESTIEVEVEKTWYFLHSRSGPPGPPPAGFVPERSWEPVEAVISEAHLYRFYYYYDTLFKKVDNNLSLAERLQIFRGHPLPQDLLAMAPGLLDENAVAEREFSDLQRLESAKLCWRILQSKFIRRVKLCVEEAKKQALKEKEEKEKVEKEKEKEKEEKEKKEQEKKEEEEKEEEEEEVQQQASKKRKTTTSRSSKRAKRS